MNSFTYVCTDSVYNYCVIMCGTYISIFLVLYILTETWKVSSATGC